MSDKSFLISSGTRCLRQDHVSCNPQRVIRRKKKYEEKDSQKSDANRNKVHERARWSKDVGTLIALGEEKEVQ